MHTCHWALNDPELARETLVLHPSGIIMVDDVFKKAWLGGVMLGIGHFLSTRRDTHAPFALGVETNISLL